MENRGLIYAYLLDGDGGGRQMTIAEIRHWTPDQGICWLHFNYAEQDAVEWILNESQLDPVSAEALLTEETRPRISVIDNAILLALRGVNLNPNSDPEDMVAIRIWADQNRIISTRKRRLLSASDIVESLKKGKGPKTTAEFVVDLTDRLINRMEGSIEEIEDRVAQLEEEVLTTESHEQRTQLGTIRRDAIMLRRYLAPQREAMIKLYSEKIPWLNENDRIRIRETTDKLIRYIEDLDSVRDRAAVTQEELANKLSEQMNARMYVLSLVAAIFLPLGFLTGLLGINIGGIPGSENNMAFYIFILMLVVIVFFQFLYFKKKKWM